VRLLINKGASLFIEVGPGKVLWGLMRQIDRSKTCVAVRDESSLQKTLGQVAAMAT
jgi:[acyl-carrier-protein] S-malonyltransferase